MKRPTGIFQDAHGLRAFVRTKDGRLRSKRFAPSELSAAKRWREEMRARVVLKLEPAAKPHPRGTFEADAALYLKAVRGMPSYEDRKRDVDAWASVFGSRVRASITPVDIRAQLETWRIDRTYAASTLNHRRTALMHLYRVLDGKSAPNPVADVPKYKEQRHAALILSPDEIARALAAMQESKSKRVLSVIAWTGWPLKQISQITKPDLSRLQEGVARATPRRKGGGSVGRWVPLLPPAIDALKALQLPGDTKHLHRSTLNRDWKHACRKAGVEPCRPYDLRHAFGTLIAKVTNDARAVQELMLHADIKQSLWYTETAGSDRAHAAIALVTGNWKQAKAFQNRPKHSGGRTRITEGKGRKSKRARQDSNLRPPA